MKIVKNDEKLLNYQNNDGNTALHLACKLWIPNTIQELLKHKKINLNLRNNAGYTPLHYVASHKVSFSILTFLIHF